MGDSDCMATIRSVLVLPACQAQPVENNSENGRLCQLRKLNFYQLWLTLMCFSMICLYVLLTQLGPAWPVDLPA